MLETKLPMTLGGSVMGMQADLALCCLIGPSHSRLPRLPLGPCPVSLVTCLAWLLRLLRRRRRCRCILIISIAFVLIITTILSPIFCCCCAS
jgi:hypothetical protein